MSTASLSVMPPARRRSTRQATISMQQQQQQTADVDTQKKQRPAASGGRKTRSIKPCTCRASRVEQHHDSPAPSERGPVVGLADAASMQRRHRTAIQHSTRGDKPQQEDVTAIAIAGGGRDGSRNILPSSESAFDGSAHHCQASQSPQPYASTSRVTGKRSSRVKSSSNNTTNTSVSAAASSSRPWAIGVNDDAPRGGLAFTFALDSSLVAVGQPDGTLTTPEDALLLAPFLFDDTDGDELHPLGSSIRRSASLPPQRSPPIASSSSSLTSAIGPPSDTGGSPSQLEEWVLSTSPRHPSTSSTSTYTRHSNSTSSTSSSSNSTSGSKSTSATSLSSNSNSHSDPSSPTSSQEGCCSNTSTTASAHNNRSSPFASKRSSDSFMLDIPRLKKRKLSHRIRSFLLLRPPGLPLPGTDGAADIQHIMKAPAWLKNATSELSRESRMAPHEWFWSGDESDHYTNWSITPLERQFKRMLKLNMDQADLEKEGRDAFLDLELLPAFTDERKDHFTAANRDEGRNEVEESLFSPPPRIRTRSQTSRIRQVSAPPAMEADPHKIANDLISPPTHDPPHHRHQSDMQAMPEYTTSQKMNAPPPEVLKSQLLAVLRSRLPEGTKNGDAPLRMKKFVVWNAWVRRSTLPTSRNRYRRRSISPENTASKDTASNHLVSPPSQVYLSEVTAEPIVIDAIEDMELKTSNIKNRNTGIDIDIDSGDPSADSSGSSSALGLVLHHDETARTARRFSRAFAEEEDEDLEEGDIIQSVSAGPFIGAKDRLDMSIKNDPVSIFGSDSNSLLVEPLPFQAGKLDLSQYMPSLHYDYSTVDYDKQDENGVDAQDSDRLGGGAHHRPRSPLRARMERKTSTATPPSYSADLAGDNHISSPYHPNHHNRHNDHEDSHQHNGMEDETIVPFWFDRARVAFDDDDGNDVHELGSEMEDEQDSARSFAYEHHQCREEEGAATTQGDTMQASSPSLSPKNRKEMASSTTSSLDARNTANAWSAPNRNGVVI